MIAYLAIAYIIQWYRAPQLFFEKSSRSLLTFVFDAATFAGSAMLIFGIIDETVMAAIGSTKPFLLVAGLAGFIYSLHALIPPRS